MRSRPIKILATIESMDVIIKYQSVNTLFGEGRVFFLSCIKQILYKTADEHRSQVAARSIASRSSLILREEKFENRATFADENRRRTARARSTGG